MSKLKVRVVSPWFGELETDEASFSAVFPLEKADALLCDWAPSEELNIFPRRKAWYCCEPWCQFKALGRGTWPTLRSRLASDEFLNHNHPDSRYRVPHVTHFESLSLNHVTQRAIKAVVVVSNFGGNPWRRHADTSFRNKFATHPLVDLYGRSGWKDYRPGFIARRTTPSNYRGEIPGDWPASDKRALLSRYKVAVCLENMNEPRYFTEKFVEAACAGCIPVYRPDEHTERGPLRGAFWVDPREHHDDAGETLLAALTLDLESVHEQNREWLRNNADLAQTSHVEVFTRIGRILSDSEGRDGLPGLAG
jgi:hypothetical protein